MPNIFNYRMFLLGLLANMQEHHYSKMNDPRICPVTFSLKGGFLNIMPRCQPISRETFLNLNMKYFHPIDDDVMKTNDYQYCQGFNIPVEYKENSFGYLNGRIVALDYGS